MQKQKQKIIKWSLLSILTVISVFMISSPVFGAEQGFWENAKEWVLNKILGLLGISVGEVIGQLVTTVVGIIAWVVAFLVFPFLYAILDLLATSSDILFGHPIIEQLWRGSLMLANGFFLLALIIASIAIILRFNTKIYNIKQILGGFITAVILSNLSLLIVRALIEAGTLLTNSIYVILGTNQTSVSGMLKEIYETVSIWETLISDEARLVFIIVVIILSIIFFKLVSILIQRSFWIFALAVAAPLAFALSLLPTTADLAKRWWSEMIKWILILPLTMGLLAIGGLVIQSAYEAEGTLNMLMGDIIAFNLSPKMAVLIIGLAILYAAGNTRKLLDIKTSIGKGLVSVSKGVQSGIKFGADTIGGKNVPGKILMTGKHELLSGRMEEWFPEGKTPKDKTGKARRFVKEQREKLSASEAKRKTDVGGKGKSFAENLWARVTNPEDYQKVLENEVKMDQGRSLVGEMARKVEAATAPLNTAAQTKHQKDWDNLTPKQQEELITDDTSGSLKAVEKHRKEERAGLHYHAEQTAKLVAKENKDSVPILSDTLNDKTDEAKAIIAAHDLYSIALDATHPESREAQEILLQNRDRIQELGLDPARLVRKPRRREREERHRKQLNSGVFDKKRAEAERKKREARKKQKDISAKLPSGIDKATGERVIKQAAQIEAKGGNLEHVLDEVDANIFNLNKQQSLDLQSRDKTTQDKTKILTNVGVPRQKVDMILKLSEVGWTIDDIKTHKQLRQAKKSPQDISKLLEQLIETKQSEQAAQTDIASMEAIFDEDTIATRPSHERAIKVQINKRVLASQGTKTDVQVRREILIEQRDNLDTTTTVLENPKVSYGNKASTISPTILPAQNREKIIQQIIDSGAWTDRYASKPELKENITIGEMASIIRRSHAATKQIRPKKI